MTIDPSGTVELVLGTMSAGQGHQTSFAQIVSEWLGVDPDQVRLFTGDTDRVQAGGGSASARSMRLGAWVMAKAADEIVEKGRRIAAALLEVAEEDVEFASQRFTVKGTDRSIGLFEAAATAAGNDLPADLRGPLIGICDQVMSLPSFPYTCAVCEVEVDPETGVVEIVRYTSIDDCGRAVNPMLVHGQSHGGIAQGVGQALWEECVYDRETAQLLSGSLMDYALPRADSLPLYPNRDQRSAINEPIRWECAAGAKAASLRGWPSSQMRSSMHFRSSASSISSCRQHRSVFGRQSGPRADNQ